MIHSTRQPWGIQQTVVQLLCKNRKKDRRESNNGQCPDRRQRRGIAVAANAEWRTDRPRPAAPCAVGATAFAAFAQGHSESPRNRFARGAGVGGAWRGDLLDQSASDPRAANRAAGNSTDDHRVLTPGTARA